MPTLADVAKRANVSKMTVSRVINHPEQVTDELKELVFSAMAELDYRQILLQSTCHESVADHQIIYTGRNRHN